MLRKVRLTIAGRYSPKGYDSTDADEGAIALILGGPKLVYALNKGETSGLPSASVIWRMSGAPKFITSWDSVQIETVRTNLDNFTMPNVDKNQPHIYTFMVDDVACEEDVAPGSD